MRYAVAMEERILHDYRSKWSYVNPNLLSNRAVRVVMIKEEKHVVAEHPTRLKPSSLISAVGNSAIERGADAAKARYLARKMQST